MAVFCPSCGTQSADGTTQCPRCGAPTGAAAPSGFGPPQGPAAGGGFGAPQSGFGAPQTPPPQQGFGAPQGGFGAPQTPPPQQGFGAPQSGFGAPQTPPPQQGFGAPQSGFGAPPGAPQGGGFGAPAGPPPGGGFGAPQTPPPQGGFGAPAPQQGGFGAPPAAPYGGQVTPPSGGGGGMSQNVPLMVGLGCAALCVMCCCSGLLLNCVGGSLTQYIAQSSVPEPPLTPYPSAPVAQALPFPVSDYPPMGYPAGFPYLPGGAPDPSTTSGVIIVVYADPPAVVFERFVSAFPANGWQMMMGTDMSEGGYRFAASSGGRVVRVMAMPEGSGSMVGVREE